MYEGIPEIIKEIEKIADACSEKYSIECFKLLLENYLKGTKQEKSETSNSPVDAEAITPSIGTTAQRALSESDLHLKFKQYMKKYGITIDTLNEIFYMDGSDILPLYDDLKTIRSSELQLRVALLQAVVSAMRNGLFEFDGEAVRAECQKRKAYDMNNYTKNFKNNASLFEGFDAYKKGDVVKLSEDGKAESAKVLKEIEK